MQPHKIVSRNEWLAAREAVRKEEQEFARKRDALIAKRRDLPVLAMGGDHAFKGPNGEVGLIDLFEGKGQLLVYHFWFEPGGEPCEGCSLWTRDLGGNFASLHDRDTTLVFVSRASSAEIETVKAQRCWRMPWYSLVGEDFAEATFYDGWAQISVFIRDGSTAYLANIAPFDDLATIGNHWTLLDRTPLGSEQP